MADRYIQIAERPVDCDVEKRILRGIVFVTRAIASDGGVVLPSGLRTDVFQAGGEVLARHALSTEARALTIGRPLALRMTDRFGEMEAQFADTELGREYAYIYGCNAEKLPYARGWSFGWDDIETAVWGLAEARRELGEDYDPDLVPQDTLKKRSVWVVKRGLLKEVSATPRRADVRALTRAWETGGIREAARLAHELQLDEAMETIAALRNQRELDQQRIAELSRDVAALRGAASPSAALGDDGGIVRELAALRDLIKSKERG
jgi:hypothetical protein